MNTTLSRIGIVFAALAGALAFGGSGGCNVGNEGERCNPDLSHDECGAGMTCQQPKDCPESYCCPTSGNSSNAYCQPGCSGGQASICAAGGDADCQDLDDATADGGAG
jgi:hypothetical protein